MHLRTVFDVFSLVCDSFLKGATLCHLFVNVHVIWACFLCILGARMRLQADIELTCFFVRLCSVFFRFFGPSYRFCSPTGIPPTSYLSSSRVLLTTVLFVRISDSQCFHSSDRKSAYRPGRAIARLIGLSAWTGYRPASGAA